MPSANAVRVCDGRDYCVSCVKQKTSELAENLKARDALTIVDDYYSRRTIALKTLVYLAISTPLFTGVFLCAGLDLAANGKGTILEAIVVAPLLSVALNLFVYALFVGSGWLLVRNPHGKLTVANGAVTYVEREQQRMAGRWDDFLFRVHTWNADPRLPWRTPILVLVYRKDGLLRRRMVTIALSQEMYNRLTGLLALTVAQQRTPAEIRHPWRIRRCP